VKHQDQNHSFKIEFKEFVERLQLVNWALLPPQQAAFEKYWDLIQQWNLRTNLVSQHDMSRVISCHFLESVAILFSIDIPQHSRVMDLGSGAGFPGIPLKIMRPDLKIVLIDSKRLKCLFLKTVQSELNLSGLSIQNQRVENLPSDFYQQFQFVLSRAVTTLTQLWEWSVPYLAPGGWLVAMKGGNLTTELVQFQTLHPVVSNFEIAYHPNLVPVQEQKKLIVIKK
jgi:16S rRNA (guanine527-N7)-methyltransferase